MLGVVTQIDGWDPQAGQGVTLRASSHDDPAVCHLNDASWWPTIAKLPKLGYDFFDGAFAGQIQTPSASITLAAEPWPAFGGYSLTDARFRLWTGEVGAPWSTWTQRVDARVTHQPELVDGQAEVTFAVDDRWLDRALLALYAGTTGAEGAAALKGTVKPLMLGTPRYVPGVLVDPVNSIFQLSGYGAINGVEAALERLARFGPSAGDYPSFDALNAASVPAGRWATSLAGGWVRFGAPPTGQVSFLASGDVAGPDAWARRPGQIIRRLALLSGGAGRIADASLNAIDAARPYNLSLYLDQQTTARELIQEVAASVNAVAGVSWMGRLFVLPVEIGAPTVTLAADGSALPPVAKVQQLEIDAPFSRIAVTAERTWTVHQLADIAFTATLVDMGDWNAGTTYREGNIVQFGGSSWLYINPAPTSGNAPPELPTSQSAFWRVLARAGANGTSAFTLLNVANCTFPSPSSIAKVAGSGNDWTGKARTAEFSTGSASVSGKMLTDTFIGLTTDPATDTSYGSIDYGLHLSNDRNIFSVWRNGVVSWDSNSAGLAPAPAGARGLVVSDGKTVRYSMEGYGEIFSHPVNAKGESLYGAFALYKDAGEQITGVTFAIGGSSGTDGLPGEPGKNGDTWYPYFAYADSPDGTINFTTGEAGSRSYVGTAGGTSPTEPQIPGLYTWSRYLGPPFGMDTRGNASVSGRTIRKSTSSGTLWDSDAYSTVGYTGGAVASASAAPGDGAMMFGLNTDPRTDSSFASIDFAWYFLGDGNLQIYENGAYIGNVAGNYTANTVLQVIYNGRYVIYMRDGDVVRNVDAGLNKTFFFDSSLSSTGAVMSNIDFKPYAQALPDISLRGSSSSQRYDTNGNPVFYDIRFDATRLNSPVDPYFSVVNSLGQTQLGWGRAIDHANNYSSLFNTTGPDNFTIVGSGQWSAAVINADIAAGGKGFYTVQVATDLAPTGNAVAVATVTKVQDGARGADSTVPGPAALALTASVSSLTFLADYGGALKSGQLAQVIVFSYTEGPNNVSSQVDWTVPEFSGCSGSMTSAGLVTFTDVASSGYVRVTGTYKGQPYTVKVPITKVLDTPPANSDQHSSAYLTKTVNSNTFPASPDTTLIVTVASNQLLIRYDLSYSAGGQGNVYVEATCGFRRAGTNDGWTNFPAVQGSQARINNNNPAEPINEQGTVSSSHVGSVSPGRYEVGVFTRRFQGAQTANLTGRLLGDSN